MGSMILYSLFSLIPGMGYWFLGFRYRGIKIAGIFTVSLFGLWLTLQMPYRELMNLALVICIGIWVGQFLITVECIFLRYQQIRNPGKAAIIPKSPLGRGDFSRASTKNHAYNIVLAQPDVSNSILIAAFMGLKPPKSKIFSINPYQVVYVGLTSQKLIIIQADKLGTPMLVETFSREKTSAEYIWGWSHDVLEISVDAVGKIKINVVATESEEAYNMASYLNQ